jgi:hypothetical protein
VTFTVGEVEEREVDHRGLTRAVALDVPFRRERAPGAVCRI